MIDFTQTVDNELAGVDITQGGATIFPLPQDVIESRAAKYHLALGDTSPGYEQVQQLLASPSGEEQLRAMSTAKQREDNRTAALDLIKTDVTASPEAIQSVAQASQTAPDVSTGMERQYAEKFFAIGMGLTNNPDEVASGADIEMSQALHDEYVAGLAKKEALLKIYEDRAAKNAQMSGLDKTYYFGKSLIPLMTWSTQRNDALGENLSSRLPGSNKREQYAYIQTLPLDQAVALVKQIDEEMAASNPQEAEQWLADLTSGTYGGVSSSLDNVFGLMDLASIFPAGKAGKLLKAGEEVAKLDKIVKAESDVSKVARLGADASEAGKVRDINNVRPAEDVTPKDSRTQWAKGPTRKTAVAYAQRLERLAAVTENKGATVDEMLAGAGHLDEAMQVQAKKWVGKAVSDGTETYKETITNMVKQTPSLFNPDAFTVSMMKGSIVNSAELRDLVLYNAEQAAKIIGNVANVSRLTPEAEKLSFKLAREQFEREAEQRGMKNAILSVVEKPAETNGFNIPYIEVKTGKKNGTLFTDAKVAENAAEKFYGYQKGDFLITQEGDGYAITSRRGINESSDEVRNAMKTADNTTNLENNRLFGIIPMPKAVNSYKDTVSKVQAGERATATHATNVSEAYARKMTAVVESLSKKEFNNLKKIMNVNRTSGPPNARGQFYQKLSDLEQAYVQHIGKLPSTQEAAAYFSMVQKSDLDWVLRSASGVRLKSRLGYARYEIPSVLKGHTLTLEGKEVSKLPFNKEYDAGVYLNYAKGGYKHMSEPGLQAILDKRIAEGNLKIIQLWDATDQKVTEALGISGHVNFIVTDGKFTKGALRFEEQVSYRPGFHVKYDYPHYIKQGKISYDSAGKRVYYGDTTYAGVDFRAKGEEFLSLLEDARKAVKNKDDAALQAVINRGLPHSLEETKRLFKDTFDTNTPFSLVRSGQSAGDNSVLSATGKSLREELGHFEDFANSPFNESRQQFTEYLGHKDGPLFSLEKKGTQRNPLYTLEDARLVDPMQTQVEALGRLICDKHFQDYQITAAESFAQEFKHLITIDGVNAVEPVKIMRNPIYYVMRGTLKKGLPESAAAQQVQTAIKNLLSHSSVLNRQVHLIREKLINQVWKKWGDKPARFIDDYTGWLATDIPTKLRAVAFHSKLGMFNPVQIALQAQTSAAITAIAPKYGLSASHAAWMMRKLDILPDDVDAIKKMAEGVGKLTPGWTKEHFIESWELLKRNGFDLVGRELSYRNDLSDYKLWKGKAAKFLDWGTYFFNETERYVRLHAWNTAYREYADKFPSLVGKMTDRDMKTILNRAQDLSINMTRDSHAIWQEGAASAATQFWGYSFRMFDLLTGKRLATREKAQLIAMNSLMYGLPIGLTPMLPIWPYEQTMREYLMEYGVDPNSGVMDSVMNGVLASSISGITSALYGDDVQLNIGGRWGPSSIQLLYRMNNARRGETGMDDLLQVFGGASGTIGMQIAIDTWPAINDVAYLIYNGEGEDILAADVLNASKNISTISNLDKAYQAYNLGVYRTKEGKVIEDDYTLAEGIFRGLTGVDPQSVQDTFAMYHSTIGHQEMKSGTIQEAKKWIRMYLEARQNDDAAADEYLTKAKGYFDALQMRPDQRAAIFKSVVDEKPLMDKSLQDFKKEFNQ